MIWFDDISPIRCEEPTFLYSLCSVWSSENIPNIVLPSTATREMKFSLHFSVNVWLLHIFLLHGLQTSAKQYFSCTNHVSQSVIAQIAHRLRIFLTENVGTLRDLNSFSFIQRDSVLLCLHRIMPIHLLTGFKIIQREVCVYSCEIVKMTN